jgi:squalene-associated FAD-dependent desaturase
VRPPQQGTIHIIGAGLAGLSCALHLSRHTDRQIRIYESSPNAGGRCRSHHDAELDRVIDNGNHLALSANNNLIDYCKTIGSWERTCHVGEPVFSFYDLCSHSSWEIAPNSGPIPFWAFKKGARPPGVRLRDVLSAFRLALSSKQTVGAALAPTVCAQTYLWDPLSESILNTPTDQACARDLWNVLRKSLFRGKKYCRPIFFKYGLSESLVTPALNYLRQRGVDIALSLPIKGLNYTCGRVTSIQAGKTEIAVDAADFVVIAVPPWRLHSLIHGTADDTAQMPQALDTESIANLHVRLPIDYEFKTKCLISQGAPCRTVRALQQYGFVGIVGGLIHWVFKRDDVLSITISAASDLSDFSRQELIETLLAELRLILNDPAFAPVAHKLIIEKRATIMHTPDGHEVRKKMKCCSSNVILTGDWTNPALPKTLESAIASGKRAAHMLLKNKDITRAYPQK